MVYQNIDVAALPAAAVDLLDRGELDWICLSSPSIARQLARLCPQLTKPAEGTRHPRLCSISPVTTAAAQQAGLTITAEAAEFTWDGLLAAISRSSATP